MATRAARVAIRVFLAVGISSRSSSSSSSNGHCSSSIIYSNSCSGGGNDHNIDRDSSNNGDIYYGGSDYRAAINSNAFLENMKQAHDAYRKERWSYLTEEDKALMEERGW